MTKFSIQCEAAEVVLVRFPFTDQTQSKLRPAVVVSPLAYNQIHGDVVLLGLTTQKQNDATLALKTWQMAGLPKPNLG